MKKSCFLKLVMIYLLLFNTGLVFSEGGMESSPSSRPLPGNSGIVSSPSSRAAGKSSEELSKNFKIHSSEPLSSISIDGKIAGTGTASYKGSAASHSVLIQHPDYDNFQTIINAESVSHYKAKTGLSAAGLAVGGVGAILGVTFFLVGSILAGSEDSTTETTTATESNSGESLRSISIPFLIGGAVGFLAPLMPVKRWKSDYYMDVSQLSHYDNDGFHRVNGFDRYGVNRKGYFTDGSHFSGRIVNGQKTGDGIYTRIDGEKYEGNFLNNKKTGLGIITDTEGNRSYGSWFDDRRGGAAVLVKSNGEREYQFWEMDKLAVSYPQNAKIISSRYKWLYLGNSSAKGLASGRGDAVTEDFRFRIKNGNFVNGKFASGTLIYPDGSRYIGNFQNDQLTDGKVEYSDGSRYKGELVNNIPHGKGAFYFTNGGSYTGDFKKGIFSGKGKLVNSNREIYEGPFVNGKPHGIGFYTYGNLAEKCEYRNGKRIDQLYLVRLERERLERDRLERERKREREKLRQLELEEEKEAERLAAAEKRSRESQPVKVERNEWAVNSIDGLKKIGEAAGVSDMGNPVYAKNDYLETYMENKKKRDEEKAEIQRSLSSSRSSSSSGSPSSGSQSGFSGFTPSVPAVSPDRSIKSGNSYNSNVPGTSSGNRAGSGNTSRSEDPLVTETFKVDVNRGLMSWGMGVATGRTKDEAILEAKKLALLELKLRKDGQAYYLPRGTKLTINDLEFSNIRTKYKKPNEISDWEGWVAGLSASYTGKVHIRIPSNKTVNVKGN